MNYGSESGYHPKPVHQQEVPIQAGGKIIIQTDLGAFYA